jgi:molybdate transport system substrate-binding protein
MVNVLCAGAAKAVVLRIAGQKQLNVEAEFGAVGAMRDRLRQGADCDVIVLTEAMIHDLAEAGEVNQASIFALGSVSTGLASPSDAKPVNVDSPQSLKAVLTNASRIYFPDPERATAGIHFMKVITSLGLADLLCDRFATFPNGATAMRAMADAGDLASIGVTQNSEILYTGGVRLLGALPAPLNLETAYAAAISARAIGSSAALQLMSALSAADGVEALLAAGFVREAIPPRSKAGGGPSS